MQNAGPTFQHSYVHVLQYQRHRHTAPLVGLPVGGKRWNTDTVRKKTVGTVPTYRAVTLKCLK